MPRHVVIVDDRELNLMLFSSIVNEIPDVVVHPFLSSVEALEWSRGNDVDCFVVDYHMPVPDGIEMIRILRACTAFARVPIVIVTGEQEREVRYRAFDAGANDFIEKPVDAREFIARISTLLALRAAQRSLDRQIGTLEASLLEAEETSSRHAERLEALWRIANNQSLTDEELIAATLTQAAATIRRGQPFVGIVGRTDASDVVVDAVAGDLAAYGNAGSLAVGARVPLARTLVGCSVKAGETLAWSDVQAEAGAPPDLFFAGWRAAIACHYTAGGATFTLLFASTSATSRPFDAHDRAYVEILAEFFATRERQRWQAERIRHQLEHDSLTGLRHRSSFRSLGRAALRPGEPFGVAVVDLVRFHEINETFGHLTGDAVLVEVGAALAAQAQAGEVVARIGGDAFGIFFPGIPSDASLRNRLIAYRAVFDKPFGIGDRDGTATVRAAATFGAAVAPADAATFDALLLLAEAEAASLAPR